MSEVLGSSITILLCKYLYKRYKCTEQRIMYIYCNSRTYWWIKQLWKKLSLYFKYSLFGNNTGTGQDRPEIFRNSSSVQFLINSYKKWRPQITGYLESAFTVKFIGEEKRELYFSPIRPFSLFIAVALVGNIVMSFVLQKQINLWGWLTRGLFLFLAVGGLFCHADWPTIKENSIFLKKIQMD